MSTEANVHGGRALLGKTLFELSGIERIHIIGCSRSGTTMLHLAMGCFEGVTLAETETAIRDPWILERLRLALRLGWRPGRKFYVTKRNYGWFHAPQVEELIAQTRLENIGIIHFVRDPRDVMLSRYVGSKRDAKGEAYVTAEHWYDSVVAADLVLASLGKYPRKLTLRYEDFVLAPDLAERQISSAFGLRRDARALPIDRVKDNFERLQIKFSEDQLQALSGLRNADAASVGRWRSNGDTSLVQAMTSVIRAKFEAFSAKHGYG